MVDLFSCSVGLERVQNNNKIGKAIQFFERLGDRPHRWNPFVLGEAKHGHALLLENVSQLIETHILQGVRKRPIDVYTEATLEVYQPKFLTVVTQHNMVKIANYMIGQRYGASKIPLHALDSIFKTYWFTDKLGITSFMDCSNMIGWLYKHTPTVHVTDMELYDIATRKMESHPQQLNYEFGCKWQSLVPDKLFDFVEDSNDWAFTCVFGAE